MRYSLRTLLLVMLLAGPLCALGWSQWTAYLAWRAEQAALQTQPLSPLSQSPAGQMYAVDTPPPGVPRLLPQFSPEQPPAPMNN